MKVKMWCYRPWVCNGCGTSGYQLWRSDSITRFCTTCTRYVSVYTTSCTTSARLSSEIWGSELRLCTICLSFGWFPYRIDSTRAHGYGLTTCGSSHSSSFAGAQMLSWGDVSYMLCLAVKNALPCSLVFADSNLVVFASIWKMYIRL